MLLFLASLAIAAPEFDQLAFMAGHWKSENNGTINEEIWLAPAGALMVGSARTVQPGPPAHGSFEHLRIENRKAGVVYIASPGGTGTTEFQLTGGDDHTAVFTNPDHDFPQRITYWTTGPDTLHARVEARDGEAWKGFELHWTRQ